MDGDDTAAGSKRKRVARAAEDYAYDGKELNAAVRAMERPPAAAKPKAAAPIKLKITQPLQQDLSVEEQALLKKYEEFRKARENLRRQPTEMTPAEKEAAAAKAAEAATKAALAAVSQMTGDEKAQVMAQSAQQHRPSRRQQRPTINEDEDEFG